MIFQMFYCVQIVNYLQYLGHVTTDDDDKDPKQIKWIDLLIPQQMWKLWTNLFD